MADEGGRYFEREELKFVPSAEDTIRAIEQVGRKYSDKPLIFYECPHCDMLHVYMEIGDDVETIRLTFPRELWEIISRQ